ncbi:hypothetical protein FWF48_02965 [Candidatus Saccharibacteria bacterium]|nr:hypothetical protein [Candidatus Saccharibacteria bacterium]
MNNENASSLPGMTGIPIPVKPKKSKSRLILVAIITIVVALLSNSVVLAYSLWYQNEDKVVADAITNVIQANTASVLGTYEWTSTGDNAGKITLDISADTKINESQYKVELSVSGFKDSLQKAIKLTGEGIDGKNGDIYVKISGIEKLYNDFDESGMLPDGVSQLIKKVDGSWIQISVAGLQKIYDNKDVTKTQNCLTQLKNQLPNDKSLQKEVADAYRANIPIKVDEKLGSKNGSLGYKIKPDWDGIRGFAKAVNKTKLAKDLYKCMDEKVSSDKDIDKYYDEYVKPNEGFGYTVEVWISGLGHKLTEIDLSNKDKSYSFKAIFKPTINQPVSINLPKKYITIEELKKDIDDIMNSYTDQYEDL